MTRRLLNVYQHGNKMALEDILKKIKEETDANISEIDSRIEKRVEEIVKEGEKKIADLRRNLLHEADETTKEEIRSRLAIAQLDFRKALLLEKRRLLDETFDAAFEDIRNLGDEDYRKLFKELALQVAEEGNGKLFISNKDRKRITPSLIKEINKDLHKMGKSATMELAQEEMDIDGGFILKMGKIEINCGLNSLFKKMTEELESEVSGILFSPEREK